MECTNRGSLTGKGRCLEQSWHGTHCMALAAGDNVGRFNGVVDCFVKTAREEGITAFYRGESFAFYCRGSCSLSARRESCHISAEVRGAVRSTAACYRD